MELFGRRAAVATFDLPCRLDALAARLPATASLDGAALLMHTLYPFYAAFQTPETREAAETDMRRSDASSAHHRLGVAVFRVRAGAALRFCPACLDAQVSALGVGTWLIPHQLPGVIICPQHGERLRDSGVTRATAGRHGYVAMTAAERAGPGDHLDDDGRVLRLEGIAHARLWSLSRAAGSLSACLRPAQPMTYWREHYLSRLSEVGLMRSAMKVDQIALNNGLKAFWGPALPHLPSPCSRFGETGWAAAMVRSHRKAMHPLFHLMLDGFLKHLEWGGEMPGNTNDMGSVSPAPLASGVEPRARLPKNDGASCRAPRVDWHAVDQRLCTEVRAAALAIRTVSPPVRVTMAEVERKVVRTDWFGKRRRKVPNAMASLRDVVEPLAEYRRRRADHWIEVLGPSCRPWEVMRAAGLRSEHLPMIREAMAERAEASAERQDAVYALGA